jgi:hypothetical protein
LSNYTKLTNFAVKDSLTAGDPAKIIKGTEHDSEYNAIATAVTSKADLASPTFTGTPSAPTPSAGTRTDQLATTNLLSSEFINSKDFTGYQKFPSGVIIQWGQTTSADLPAGATLMGVAFPSVFPTTSAPVVVIADDSNQFSNFRISDRTSLGFNITAEEHTPLTVVHSFNWIAIGF